MEKNFEFPAKSRLSLEEDGIHYSLYSIGEEGDFMLVVTTEDGDNPKRRISMNVLLKKGFLEKLNGIIYPYKERDW